MTILKCRDVGNSLGVLLPAHARQQLNLRKGDALSAAVINGALVLRPISPRTEQVMSLVPDLLRKHADALHGLGDE